MKQPVVAITGGIEMYEEEIFRGFFRVHAVANYVDSIIRAGGVPIVVPPTHLADRSYLSAIAGMIDGLLLTGGNDIDPARYGEEPHPDIGQLMVSKDYMEVALLDMVVPRNIPILGICRGMQMLNVYFGGTLYQDLKQNPQFTVQHEFKTDLSVPTHNVQTEKDSVVRSIVGEEYRVNSAHHQAVKELAEGCRATAHTKDGLVEAIEHEESKFILGVQWHPEMMAHKDQKMQEIFNTFIKACVS